MKKNTNDGASRIVRQKNEKIEKVLKKYRKITTTVPPSGQ